MWICAYHLYTFVEYIFLTELFAIQPGIVDKIITFETHVYDTGINY